MSLHNHTMAKGFLRDVLDEYDYCYTSLLYIHAALEENKMKAITVKVNVRKHSPQRILSKKRNILL